MDSIVFALLVAGAFLGFIVWLQVQTMKLNRKRKAEGKEAVGAPLPVNVIDWTGK
jgi:uncharacterized membrane protein